MRTVTLYGRPGCHLCDDAMAVLHRIQRDHAFSLEVIDIESDDGLMLQYLERIPVIAVDGEELCEFFVNEGALVGAIANLSPPPSGPAH